MSPQVTPGQLSRVALAKVLLSRAHATTGQSEPLCAFAVLEAQDAVEMLLRVICEVYHVNVPPKANFLDHWSLIKEKTGSDLKHKSAMDSMNSARVGFKHKGVIPSQRQCRESYESGLAFARDACTDFLHLDFDRVSLVHLVEWDEVRTLLREAEESLASSDYKVCQEKAALAFAMLERHYAELERKVFGPFYRYRSRTGMGGASDPLHRVKEELDELHKALQRMEMGLDYSKLRRFLSRAPRVVFFMGGAHKIYWGQHHRATAADCSYSITFVVESALIIQRLASALGDPLPQEEREESAEAGPSDPAPVG